MRRARVALLVVPAMVAAMVAALGIPPAGAWSRGPQSDGSTDAGGATVHVIDRSVSDGSGGTHHGASGGCVRSYVATTELVYKFPQARFDAPRELPPAPSPFHQAFDVYCDGTYLATVWAVPQAAAAAVGAELARELLARVEFPPVRIAANPGRGLTGLDSWFWID
ncbi:MAG TPA: hypothetical protein VFC99_14760, partial [Acidimicrobiia bacterium]|nr:hypothetical protein [Acidimicrobiia bacterium]